MLFRSLNRDISNKSRHTREKSQSLIAEMECTDCHGKRLNGAALSCKIKGYHIADLCCMELTGLREVLAGITDQRVDAVSYTHLETFPIRSVSLRGLEKNSGINKSSRGK